MTVDSRDAPRRTRPREPRHSQHHNVELVDALVRGAAIVAVVGAVTGLVATLFLQELALWASLGAALLASVVWRLSEPHSAQRRLAVAATAVAAAVVIVVLARTPGVVVWVQSWR